MKSLLLVLLSLCSPIPAQESADYVDVVAPYPRRAANDRRAQSFLSGSHSPDAMKMFANMMYNYLKGVSVPHKNEEDDYETEENHLKAKNLELVQDAFEKTSLRHLLTPPPSYPPIPIGPPPPPSFNDYDIGAPGLPPVESDRPLPPPMPKFKPIRYHSGFSTPFPTTIPPPSRVLLFKPSSIRRRPDEFIVRPPPRTQFNSPYEQRFLTAVSRFVDDTGGRIDDVEAANRSKIRACIRSTPGGGCYVTDE
ncbi:hypothetical protein PRIPAC_71683 [Pristionchus pacificus]|uniref:Uncharacterized protein n=1 Tax=Pristionchus pacificus TaxID=54126 RepID=A0A2A6CR57_PRIPA|nr:hypothetical protein PRIPAC_71683 [Pristionchus pacificus]|eukprot:PDM80619.1 hypothetical protein PRIPAC_35622 [Pristionchus pacificus]